MATVDEVLNKLQKLKQQATIAPDFQSLEKVSNKVDKIRGKLSDNRNKQLNTILDKIDLLISEKNKYFRQKIIKNSAKLIEENTVRNQEADRTLKYSKSAENLKMISKKGMDASISRRVENAASKITGQENGLDGDSENLLIKTNKQKTVYIRGNRDQQAKNNEQLSEFLQTSSVINLPQNNQVNSKRNIKSTIQGSSSMKNIQKNIQQIDLNAEKTTIIAANKLIHGLQNQQKKRLQNQIGFLQQKLSYSFKQIEDLSKKVSSIQNTKQIKQADFQHFNSPMSKNYLKKQQNIVDQYSQKIREKSFIIEDLKAKLQYFKSMNEELKSRMINQQRSNQDYTNDLRSEIKNAKKQMQKLKKQNNNIKVELEDVEQKNQGLMNEIKKLVSKLQEQTKDKQNIKKITNQAANSRIQELQKEVSRLTTQLLQMSKLQIKIQHENQQKKQLSSSNLKLATRLQQLQSEYKLVLENRNKIELEIFKLQEENKYVKSELRINIQAKQMLAEQLLQVINYIYIQSKQKLEQQMRVTGLIQYENDLKAKNKLNKLKQIRTLLTELR